MVFTLRSLLAVVVTQVAAQGPGQGISKNTVAVSSRSVFADYKWKMKYLPVDDADDSCQNNKCQCGATARVALKVGSSAGRQWQDQGRRLQPSPGFGIHGVYAAGTDESRAKASGMLSVEDIEDIFDQQLGNLSSYSPWMDVSRVGLYVSSLDSYITAFKGDGVAYLSLSWKDGSNTYYSIIVHVPQTQEVFEIMSKAKPSGEHVGAFRSFEGLRHQFLDDSHENTQAGYATAVHVSRTARNLTTVIDFYKEVFGISPVAQGVAGAAKYAFFQHDSQATVQIQYWQRDGQSGNHTTQWFEEYLEKVNSQYMTTSKSCWPIWGDNHYCFDSMDLDMNALKDTYDSKGYKYHLFSMPGGGSGGGDGNGYFELPGGWQMQIDGNWPQGFPSDTDTFDPDYCGTTCEASPSPPTPSPPSPSPKPGPSPTPGAHCDQCNNLIASACSSTSSTSCRACAKRHSWQWDPIGCQVGKCPEEVREACSSSDIVV